MIELCNSPAKVAKIPIPTKCFWENFEVSKNIFFQVIETKSLMALYMIMGIVSREGYLLLENDVLCKI